MMTMKKIIKSVLKSTGYVLVKDNYYNKLVNVNAVQWLDCNYLLKDTFSKIEYLTIFDIGANVGQTSKKFFGYYPNATIYCFEPVKDTFLQLQKNVADLPNLRIHNFAFGNKMESIQVFHREDSEWNSLVSVLNERAKENGASSETIEVKTVDQFLAAHSIDRIHFFKSDTEGYELNVLEGASDALKKQTFDFLYLEVGFNPEDYQHTYIASLITFLEQYNYRFSGLFEKAYLPNHSIAFANALFAKC